MKYINLTLVFICCLTLKMSAQIPTGRPGDLNGFKAKTWVSKNVKGSPYIQNDFVLSNIQGYQGTYLVRYNGVNEEMELKAGNAIKIVPSEYVNEITLVKSKESYNSILVGENKKIFALVIWSNQKDDFLFARHKVSFKEGKKAENSLTQDLLPTYTRQKDIYYLKFAKGKIIELSSRKKKFYAAFKGKENDVKDFVKKQKLKIDNPDDLKKIAAFYFG